MTKKFMFEHKLEPILPHSQFLKRLLCCALVSLGLLTVTIGIGTVTYLVIEHQSWIDALLNAVMIMSGLGLQGALTTSAGKLFTSFFALISAFVFYTMLAILFTPLLHRFLHHFHIDDRDNK